MEKTLEDYESCFTTKEKPDLGCEYCYFYYACWGENGLWQY